MDPLQAYGVVCGVVGFLGGIVAGGVIFFNLGWRKGFRQGTGRV